MKMGSFQPGAKSYSLIILVCINYNSHVTMVTIDASNCKWLVQIEMYSYCGYLVSSSPLRQTCTCEYYTYEGLRTIVGQRAANPHF